MKFAISFLFFHLFSGLLFPQYSGKLIQIDSCKYLLRVTKHNPSGDSLLLTKRLPYPVFKLIQADANNDGQDDFITGIIKKTTFDSIPRKRINIWKVEKDAIVPLWLGSKMSHPLYDFVAKRAEHEIHFVTIEFEADGKTLMVEYKWHSFGLKFIQYLNREISLDEANKLLNVYGQQNM
jgi:hypothetical protein